MNVNISDKSNTRMEYVGLALGGVILSILVSRLLDMGSTPAMVGIGALVVLVACLDGYRAWMLLVVAAMFNGYRFNMGPLTIRPEQVIFLAMVAGWALSVLAGRMRLHRVPLLLPIMAYLGINLLSSVLFSPNKAHSYQSVLLMTLYASMYVMTVTVLQNYPERIKAAVKFFLVVGLLQALYGIITLMGHFAGVDLGELTRGTDSGGFEVRVQGGFQESNIFGSFEAIITLLSLGLLSGDKVGIKKSYLTFAVIIGLTATILAFTRAAWLGIFIGLIILLFVHKQRSILNARVGIAAIMVAGLIAIGSLPVVDSFTGGLSSSVKERFSHLIDFEGGSGAGRVELQAAALDRWEERPLLGTGTASLPPGFAYPTDPGGAFLYSSVVQALHDTGIAGLLLHLWVQAGIMVVIVRGFLRTKDHFYKAALAGFTVAYISMMIASQASSLFWLGIPWIFAGLAVAVSVIAQGESTGSVETANSEYAA